MTSSLIKVLNNVDLGAGGSGTGCSFYTTASNCGKKAQLIRSLKESGKPYSGGSFATDVGTIFHALMEFWYGTGDELIELDDLSLDETQTEAMRLFNAYKKEHRIRRQLLNVVGCEYPIDDKDGTTHMFDTFGVEFTCRIDMVVELTQEACDYLSSHLHDKHPQISHELEPGVWLWDFKTAGSKDKLRWQKAKMRPQFIAYQIAWNAKYPDRPVKGMISDYVMKAKTVTFELAVTPPPSELDEAVIKGWLNSAQGSYLRGEPNLSECDNFGVCGFYLNGMCNRV